MSLIGRQREKAKFAEIMESDQPAFVAINCAPSKNKQPWTNYF